jgi:rubrerythrin
MKSEYLKTLWMLRFEKLRKNEEEAAWKYQEILNQCKTFLKKEDPVLDLLEQLIREERMHEGFAGELIRVCQRTHPECGVLFS